MISIILVDDHVIMRDGLLLRLLEGESDIEVVSEADNGREAVKIALEKKLAIY